MSLYHYLVTDITEMTDYQKLVDLSLHKRICQGPDCNEELWFKNITCSHEVYPHTFVTTMPHQRGLKLVNNGIHCLLPHCLACHKVMYICDDCEYVGTCSETCRNTTKCLVCKKTFGRSDLKRCDKCYEQLCRDHTTICDIEHESHTLCKYCFIAEGGLIYISKDNQEHKLCIDCATSRGDNGNFDNEYEIKSLSIPRKIV